MFKDCNKKIIIFGIIVIFLLATITPNIVGYKNKANISLENLSSKSYPLNNDDYINAYWKFNECSGDTIGDSSVHNYNGARNGATWVTNGFSGCALEFDGVNDYVELTPHVEGIAFNKSDDYLISFYFKSTLDEKGIIFSLTGYKNVPEFRIEVQPNGSILFRIWTGLCGMVLFSEEGFADGSWHKVLLFFNGISTDPTMEIYVDDDLVGELTRWLCPIEHADYLAATMGKRASDDTGFFKGIIDELKFIKYERGNEQEPPTIDGPTIGEPNVEYEFEFTINDPEDDEILKLIIDWDDGNVDEIDGHFDPGDVVTASHTWTEEDRFDIKAKSFDIWDDSPWAEHELKIGNQPPTDTSISGQKYGSPSETITYTFVAEDEENEDIRYEIDWDDGTTTETGYFPSGTPHTEDHSWSSNNDYNITARALDENGKDGDWVKYHIRIGDQPPSMPKIYGAVQGLPGIKYDYALISTDPENDNISFDVDWGDGTVETDLGPILSGDILSISHKWNNSRTYTIKVRAKDIFDYNTLWTEFDVIIPRNKALHQNLLEHLFERLPYKFPIIRYIFNTLS